MIPAVLNKHFLLGSVVGFLIGISLFLVIITSSISYEFKKMIDPCPYLFQEIKMLEMTSHLHLGDVGTTKKHFKLLQGYVQKDCPIYEGLENQIIAYNQTLND